MSIAKYINKSYSKLKLKRSTSLKSHKSQCLQNQFIPYFSITSIMNVTTNATNSTCNDADSKAAEEMYTHFSYWTEYVIQSIIGVAGIAANTVAIPVLCSREMNSIFNRLLMFLAIFDNFFIICQMLEAHRKMTNTNNLEAFNQAHEYVFAYFLYEFHAFVLCCSMYITVALALERYRAVWRPIEYHNMIKGVNPWNRVIMGYVLPVIVFSLLFNIPKCFEIKLQMYPVSNIYQNDSINGTLQTTVNLTFAVPTALRLNDIYVVVYANLAKLTVQGIIPFVSLSFLNYRIYWVMIRRRQLINRPTPKQPKVSETEGTSMIKQDGKGNSENSSAQRKANEAKQAFVLFIIVLLYFICHTPRFLINVHEFFNLDLLKEGMEQMKDGQEACDSFPVWALACTSVSHCLLTLNSSSNFYIYCFMCSTFRDVLCQWVLRLCKFFSCLCCNRIQPFFTKKQNGTVNGSDATTIGLGTLETNINPPTVKDTDTSNSRVCIIHDNACSNNPDEISHVKFEKAE